MERVCRKRNQDVTFTRYAVFRLRGLLHHPHTRCNKRGRIFAKVIADIQIS